MLDLSNILFSSVRLSDLFLSIVLSILFLCYFGFFLWPWFIASTPTNLTRAIPSTGFRKLTPLHYATSSSLRSRTMTILFIQLYAQALLCYSFPYPLFNILSHEHRRIRPDLSRRIRLRPHGIDSFVNLISSSLIPIHIRNLGIVNINLHYLRKQTFGGSLPNAFHLSSFPSYSLATVLRARVFAHSGSEIAMLSTASIAARPSPVP